jgi:hypothetical protein
MVAYLIGTEAPDNSAVATTYTADKVYGDKSSGHHNYYNLEHAMALDDSASKRAQEEYAKSLQALRNGDYRLAAFYAGAMSHYISDVAVWAHVRGKGSPHGSEDSKKHSEYETEVDKTIKAKFYSDTDHTSRIFQSYMVFDGVYDNITAYDAAYLLGLNSDSGGGGLDSVQMEQLLPMGPNGDGSYVGVDDWQQNYKDRTGESLDLAANAVADVLYKLNIESGKIVESQPTIIQIPDTVAPVSTPAVTSPTPPKAIPIVGAVMALMIILLISFAVFKGNKEKKRSKKRKR